MSDRPEARSRHFVYWTVVVALVAFGTVAIFSIGMPFLLLGLTLAIVGPWRDRPTVLWPAVAGVVGFVVGALVALPWACSSVTSLAPGSRAASSTGSCSTALGVFHYGSAAPSYVPGLAAAAAVAVVAAVVTHRAIRRRRAAPARAEA